MLLDSSNTVGMRLKHPADLVNFTGFAAGRNFFKVGGMHLGDWWSNVDGWLAG